MVARAPRDPRTAHRGPRILGAHLEGPFLSPARLGTHGLAARRDPDAGAARAPARRRPRAADDARARAAGRARADRPAPRRAASPSRSGTPTRPRPRPTRRSTAACARSPTSSTRCGPLAPPRPGDRRRGARAPRRRRPGDRRRRPPRPRHRPAPLAPRRRPDRARHRRDRGRGARRRHVRARRDRDRRRRRRRAPRGRRARGQRADDDRRPCGTSSRSACRSRRRSRLRAPSPRACSGDPRSGGSSPAGPADVVVLDDALEVVQHDRRRRDACRRLSRPATRHALRRRRSASSPRRCGAFSSTTPRSRASRPPMRDRDARLVRMVGHGSSDNAASYGVYAFGLLPHWTAMRDSITLTVHYGTPLDMTGSTVIGLSQSGRTPDVVEYVQRARAAGAFTIARHERPGVGARDGRRGDDPARGRARARGRGDEDVRQHARARSRSSPATSPAAARELADGIRGASRADGGGDPGARALDGGARALVLLHGPHVRDRPRRRVRDRARDRAEAARDVPDRGRAAHGDGPRARPGRGARPAVPRLGDRLERRDARDRAGSGGTRAARWARRSSRAGRRPSAIKGAAFTVPVPTPRPALLSPLLSVVPGQLFARRCRGPAGSTRTRRTASRR